MFITEDKTLFIYKIKSPPKSRRNSMSAEGKLRKAVLDRNISAA
jgi:hypothetical protein